MENRWLYYQVAKFPRRASPLTIVKGKSFGDGGT